MNRRINGRQCVILQLAMDATRKKDDVVVGFLKSSAIKKRQVRLDTLISLERKGMISPQHTAPEFPPFTRGESGYSITDRGVQAVARWRRHKRSAAYLEPATHHPNRGAYQGYLREQTETTNAEVGS